MNLSLTKNSPAQPHRRPAIFPPSPGGRRRNSGFPMTPSLRWKLEDRRSRFQFQARKIAFDLWQVLYREISGGHCGGRKRSRGEKRHLCLEQSRNGEIEAEQWLQRRHCFDSSNNGINIKAALSATEYWNPETPDAVDAADSDNSHSHCGGTASEKKELAVAQTRIRKLEFQHRNSKKKIEHLKGKLEENRAMYNNRRTNMMKLDELDEEIKTHQRIEILNANFRKELAEAKSRAKRYKQEHEKEKRNRELLEEVCAEMAKQIVGDRAKMESLKRESMKLCEELEEERNMLQLGEIWREERVQMKLIDAKLALEDKYNQMNKLINDLENFMISRSEKAEMIHEAAKTQSVVLSLIEDFKEDSNLEEIDNRNSVEKECICENPFFDDFKVNGRSGRSVGELEGSDSVSQRNLENPHVKRGTYGCVEWPRGIQKNCLKAKTLDAMIQSQKSQLRHVLSHKMN